MTAVKISRITKTAECGTGGYLTTPVLVTIARVSALHNCKNKQPHHKISGLLRVTADSSQRGQILDENLGGTYSGTKGGETLQVTEQKATAFFAEETSSLPITQVPAHRKQANVCHFGQLFIRDTKLDPCSLDAPDLPSTIDQHLGKPFWRSLAGADNERIDEVG